MGPGKIWTWAHATCDIKTTTADETNGFADMELSFLLRGLNRFCGC